MSKVVHYDIHRFAKISILHPSTHNKGYVVNKFYLFSADGTMVSTHATAGLAVYWAMVSYQHNMPRHVYKYVDRLGFIRLFPQILK